MNAIDEKKVIQVGMLMAAAAREKATGATIAQQAGSDERTLKSVPPEKPTRAEVETKIAMAAERTLEDLSVEERDVLVDATPALTLMEIVAMLGKKGLKTNKSTLSRFLRNHRAATVIQDGNEMAPAVEELAKRNQGETLRAGSLEAVRQRMFERAVDSRDPKEGMRIYETLVGEEERLKKHEVETRKVALQERALELQAQRLRVEAERGGAKLFLEALKILSDEGIGAETKVRTLRERLEAWNGKLIELKG